MVTFFFVLCGIVIVVLLLLVIGAGYDAEAQRKRADEAEERLKTEGSRLSADYAAKLSAEYAARDKDNERWRNTCQELRDKLDKAKFEIKKSIMQTLKCLNNGHPVQLNWDLNDKEDLATK